MVVVNKCRSKEGKYNDNCISTIVHCFFDKVVCNLMRGSEPKLPTYWNREIPPVIVSVANTLPLQAIYEQHTLKFSSEFWKIPCINLSHFYNIGKIFYFFCCNIQVT